MTNPVLYQSPTVLTAEGFGRKRVSPAGNFSFAVKAGAIPLAANEFTAACRTLPIVFTNEDCPLPVAVVGIEGANSFIDADGSWDRRCYLPDYVRRYPFIFFKDEVRGVFHLCVDEAFAGLNEDDGEPLFVNGQPSLFTKSVMEYCQGYQARFEHTEAFCAELKRLDLLVPYTASLAQPQGAAQAIAGFQIVDPQRWQLLPDADLVSLRKQGWLEAVVAHLISQANWQDLADRKHFIAGKQAEAGDGKGKKRSVPASK